MGLAAQKRQVALPRDTAVDAEIDLAVHDGSHFLRARLNVSVPGVEAEVAQAFVDAAHQARMQALAKHWGTDYDWRKSEAKLNAYHNLTYFHDVGKGGHFAAWEKPQLFATEIRAAFRTRR